MPRGKEVYAFLSAHPCAAAVRLRHVHLLPAPLCGLCSSPCGPFVPEYAKHRRTAAGHQGGDSAMLPQQGLDGPGILCPAALFQRIAGGGTKGIQISGTDSGFLRSAVRVDAAAHRS